MSIQIKTEVIGFWRGDNYIEIIRIMVRRNPDMTVRVKGKRLIVKDPNTGFYKCITHGDKVEIPQYPEIDEEVEDSVEINSQ